MKKKKDFFLNLQVINSIFECDPKWIEIVQNCHCFFHSVCDVIDCNIATSFLTPTVQLIFQNYIRSLLFICRGC